MVHAPPDDLPSVHQRAILAAWAPPDLRQALSRLPRSIALDAVLPPPQHRCPPALLSLIKLALHGEGFSLSRIVVADAPSVTARSADRSLTLDHASLARPERDVAWHVVSSLFSPDELCGLLSGFATRAATSATLHALTRQMLERGDLDRALYAMLSGVTSGWGLGLNRVALFVADGSGDLVGQKAIGPADEAEAHRIWEELEASDTSFDGLLDDYEAARHDRTFEALVQQVRIDGGDRASPWVLRALEADGPTLVEAGALAAGALAPLSPGDPFVLAPVRTPGRELRALLFADNVYSRQPIDQGQLELLSVFVAQSSLVYETMLLLDRVERLATRDELTGVLNRRGFRAHLARSFTPGASALVLIDVDRFKQLNDTQGHAAGDQALRALGRIFDAASADHAVAGRLGGDEFALFVARPERAAAEALCRHIGEAAAAQGISLSMGLACSPDDGDSLEALELVADRRLYAAKRHGRGRAALGDGTPIELSR